MDTPRRLLRSNFKCKIKSMIKSDFGYKVLLVNASGVFFSLWRVVWGRNDLWRGRDLGKRRLCSFDSSSSFCSLYSFSHSAGGLGDEFSIVPPPGFTLFVFLSALCCRQSCAFLRKVSNVRTCEVLQEGCCALTRTIPTGSMELQR